VLARLNQVPGVQGSYTNGSGTLLLLDLGPGAEPGAVTAEARRVLSEEVADRVPVPLDGRRAAEAVRGEQWQDQAQAAESAATPTPPSVAAQMRTAVRRGTAVLAALLLGCVAFGLLVLGWRHRRRRSGEEDGGGRFSAASP
jgi:hypothetical protein